MVSLLSSWWPLVVCLALCCWSLVLFLAPCWWLMGGLSYFTFVACRQVTTLCCGFTSMGSRQWGPLSLCWSYSSGCSTFLWDPFFREITCYGLLLLWTTIAKVWVVPCTYAPFSVGTIRDKICSSKICTKLWSDVLYILYVHCTSIPVRGLWIIEVVVCVTYWKEASGRTRCDVGVCKRTLLWGV